MWIATTPILILLTKGEDSSILGTEVNNINHPTWGWPDGPFPPFPRGQWPPGWHGRYMFSIGRFSETKISWGSKHNSSIHPAIWTGAVFERCPQTTTQARCCWWDCYIQISFTYIILGKWLNFLNLNVSGIWGHTSLTIHHHLGWPISNYGVHDHSWPTKAPRLLGTSYIEYVDIWWKPQLDIMEPSPIWILYIYPFTPPVN